MTPTPTVVPPPTCVNTKINLGGDFVSLYFNKSLSSLPLTPAGFTVTADSVTQDILNVELQGTSPVLNDIILLDMGPSGPVPFQVVQVQYTPGSITSTDGGVLAGFSTTAVWT